MLPRPKWLPGLDQDKREKERLKKLYKLTVEEYDRHIPKGMAKDQKASEEASRAAVEFYSRNVNGETMTHSAEKVKMQEAAKRTENSGSVMNYVNISADPHVDPKEAQQIRVNVVLDRVKENVISDSVRFEGMVFIDVFDTTGITDGDLKTKIDEKKSVLEYYRNNDIGLVKPAEGNIPSLAELIHLCGLSIEEYDLHWKNFKLELNNLGFKIVPLIY
jgi:HSP90 family molecular chaperone